MRASSRVLVAVVVAIVATACSLVVDFDRSKIHGSAGGRAGAGGSSNTGGSAGEAEGGLDSGAGGALDAGMGGTAGDMEGGADHTVPPACDPATHAGCAADELCCDSKSGPVCRKTSLTECEACGVACPSKLAKSCDRRTCECDPASNRTCSGKGAESFCVQSGSQSARCVECRDVTDCAGRSDGKGECVDGRCVACDPSKMNSGCSGTTPICDSTTLTCKPCTASPNDCPGTLVCTAGGACGGCASSASDCTTPTTPICDSTTTECRGCGSNEECTSERGQPYCIDSARCSPCDPTTEMGCSDPTKPDCRAAADGNFACQACTTSDDCQNLSTTPVCDVGTGRCVACTSDDECTANAKAPLCVGNACVACDTASIAASADSRCAAKPGGAAVCVRSGTAKGQCGACDPSSSAGCTTTELCCEQSGVPACMAATTTACTACGVPCNPVLANACTNRGCSCGSSAACSGTGKTRFCAGSPGACVECVKDADCSDAAAPLCEGNQCVSCQSASDANTRCAAKGAGACASTGTHKGQCAACDPASNTGCVTLTQCDPATAMCVDCINDAGCSGKNDKCLTSTHSCVDCTDTGGCADVPATPICGGNVCRACASDAECVVAAGSLGPICGASGCGPGTACTTSGDCTDGVHGQCVDVDPSAAVDNRCRACDPDTNAGCTAGQTCTAGFVCTT